ncbi:unnamed protein product [Mytilus coruscus]|uniref:C2H2-type domain-containing protein n=1 Tax=Mytilus coruscus TaxID=42192 RepID=A0A6J8CQ06_MYTCO|nr:unnamed protein product [Mytilus coruscus]
MFGCPSCKFKDADEKTVKKHTKIKHGVSIGEITIKTRNDKIRMYKVPCGESGIKSEDNKKQLSGGIAFKCKACKRTFKNRNACMYHAISALCNKMLKGCSHCDYKDMSTDNVESHIKKVHKEKNVKVMELPMEAKVEMISTPPSTKMNVTNSGTIAFFKKGTSGYICRLCDFKCNNSTAVIKHQNMHNASPKYGCPYCDMKSNWSKSVKNHVSLRHQEQEQIVQSLNQNTEQTSLKDKSTDIISTVSKTTEDDKGNKCIMHKCLQCNYRCETYSGVSRHIKRNESCNVPRFKCIDCHKFTSLNEIEVKEHMRTAHNSKKTPGICSLKEMTKMIIVRKKSSTRTPALSEKDSSTDKSRIAEKFSGMKDIETKVIKCPVLSCNCKDKIIKVIEHYRREHPSKVMKCKMCTMSSKSLGIMFKHFQDFHKLEEYYSTNFLTCSGTRDDIKSKSMKNDILTNDNIREQEVKANAHKLYHCDRCEFVSKAKNSTRRHIYRHMNYKRYLCRLCKAEFLDRSACENHMAIHNTESEEFDKITNERLEKEVEGILENNMVLGSKESDNSNSIERVKSKKKEDNLETISETKSKTKQNMKSDFKNKNEIIKDCKGALSNKVEKKRTSDIQKVDFTNLSADAFNQANFIREEQNKNTQEIEYLCTKCPYKSIARHCALCHTYRHMPKCMKCPYCNFQSYPRSDITRHVRNTHADKAVHVIDLRHQTLDGKEKPRSPDKKRKKTILDFDAEIFTSEGSSDEEEEKRRKKPLQKTSGGSESPKTDDKIRKIIYSCNLCDYSTDVLYLYRQHLTFHPGFKHQIQGTSLESKNKCGYCGYIATNSKEFDKHMERHLNSRPYNCPYCQFSQYNQASVRYHIQNKHPGEKVEVLKDRSSSCLTGDGKIPKVMLVNIEPNILLRDIFTMESESFEELLINANVSVIDLHSIPDEQFGNVSKLLGVNGDEDEWKPSPQKKRKVIEETEETDEEGRDHSDIEVDARNYCDASDHDTNSTNDGTHIADDESHNGEGEHISEEKYRNKGDRSIDKTVNEKKKSAKMNTPSTTNVSSTEYEDISDTEMDSENGAIFKMNEQKFYVKSELTYEDISDTDDF